MTSVNSLLAANGTPFELVLNKIVIGTLTAGVPAIESRPTFLQVNFLLLFKYYL
jgi:hypothetical protein